MFDIRLDKNGEPFLKWTEQKKPFGEKGHWVEIGRVDDKELAHVVDVNRRNGMLVLVDDRGIYRALVLTE